MNVSRIGTRAFLLFSAGVLVFVILSENALSAGRRVFEYDVPAVLDIAMSGSSFKRYINLIEQIDGSPTSNIQEKFKTNRFKLVGTYLDGTEQERLFSGSARVSGDWKDHIDASENLSSISVSLKQGNVGGVVKFRLLIPKTKLGANEIFWSLLMEDLGYPVPYRRLVSVNFMGQTKQFIFEEKPEKEFLESNGIRESPILEYDERQRWANVEVWNSGRAPNNETQLFHQRKIKNADFLKNDIAYEIAYRGLHAPIQENNEVFKTFNELNSIYASHGLSKINTKLIYDATYNQYLPIYFDGMVLYKNYEATKKDQCDFQGGKDLTLRYAGKIAVLQAKFKDRVLGQEFEKRFACIAARAYDRVEGSAARHRTIAPIERSSYTTLNAKIDVSNEGAVPWIYRYDYVLGRMERCVYSSLHAQSRVPECEEASAKVKQNVFSGDDRPQVLESGVQYSFLEFLYTKVLTERFYTMDLLDERIKVTVAPGETAFIDVRAAQSEIDVTLQDGTARVVFHNSIFTNSFVNVVSEGEDELDNTVRYDSRLLTGCMTFMDSDIRTATIKSSKCRLEDAVNFIRVRGESLTLSITDAQYDGFDADFSDIQVDSIEVLRAGNDCLDVSSGIYNIKKASLSNCGDKGLSFGEKSHASLVSASIMNAEVGLASKDQSFVSVGGDFTLDDVAVCLWAYQKKQEFGVGAVNYRALPDGCSTKGVNGKGTNPESCLYVSRNYFFSTCVSEDSATVKLAQEIPENFSLVLKNGSTEVKKSCAGGRPCDLVFEGLSISDGLSIGLKHEGSEFMAEEFEMKAGIF
jgi:hypothetical protein